MNTWSLVMVILYSRGVAIQEIEFSSQQACQEAASKMKIVESGWNKTEPYLICLNKGEKQ